MSICFNLAVECGPAEIDATLLISGLTPLLGVSSSQVYASDGAFWAVMRPDLILDTAEDRACATEHVLAALASYQGAYRYGFAGVAMATIRTWEQVQEDITLRRVMPGFMLSEATFQALDRPEGFSRVGHGWYASAELSVNFVAPLSES